ncbi:hypothetical protein FO519_009032 [Halicephalobus sp. NKZ332]|nr:hypothetical protein FO519_009032 [Halicephalobus sp. NKZ332]
MISTIKRRDFLILTLFGVLLIIYYYCSNGVRSSYYKAEKFKLPDDAISLFQKNYTCPNVDEGNLVSSKGVDNSRIAIIIAVLKGSDYQDYDPAVKSVECYANHYGYHVELINMTADPKILENCPHEDVFFKRHCATVFWMKENVNNFDYILFIDADIGVINPCHHIQEYIDDDPKVEIIFYDRYYNDEIMAGSYFARNSEYARDFLKFWANYYYRLPKSFHGTDNGAIQQVFMELHFSDRESQMQCYDIWNKSNGYDSLFTFEICTRHALGDGSYYCDGRAKIIRKGTWGWSRDGWLTGTDFAPSDFMFHGWKKQKLNGEWVWPFKITDFDLSKCQPGQPFVNFGHNFKHIKTDEEIMTKLVMKKLEGRRNYFQVLEKLKRLCSNGTEFVNGIKVVTLNFTMASTNSPPRTSEIAPAPTDILVEDDEVADMTEIEHLKHENKKLQQENETLKLDCKSYTTIMDVERGKHQKRCQELEDQIAHLSEAFEFDGQSKGLAEVLKKNMEIILVSERELKVIYETQQQMADRALAVHCHLNSLSKRIVDKMDELGIETDGSASTFHIDEELVEENFFLKNELEHANMTIREKNLEIKELKSGASEKADSNQEIRSPVNNDLSMPFNTSNGIYEEQFRRYEEEIELLKDVVAKLARDKKDDSLVSNEEQGQVAVLTARLVMARLALGELKPAEAYNILQEANALATYTMGDLEIIAASTCKKKAKMTPMKRLKRIFSTKRTVREPAPSVAQKK